MLFDKHTGLMARQAYGETRYSAVARSLLRIGLGRMTHTLTMPRGLAQHAAQPRRLDLAFGLEGADSCSTCVVCVVTERAC